MLLAAPLIAILRPTSTKDAPPLPSLAVCQVYVHLQGERSIWTGLLRCQGKIQIVEENLTQYMHMLQQPQEVPVRQLKTHTSALYAQE